MIIATSGNSISLRHQGPPTIGRRLADAEGVDLSGRRVREIPVAVTVIEVPRRTVFGVRAGIVGNVRFVGFAVRPVGLLAGGRAGADGGHRRRI